MRNQIFNIQNSIRKSGPRIKKWDWWILLILAGGLAFRLVLAHGCRFAISFDEAHYLRLAARFREAGFSGLFHPYWPPFFSLAIAIANWFIPSLETAGRIVNMFSGVLMIWLVYRMARELFGPWEARISACFIAFHPPLAFGSTNVMPESLFSLTVILGIFIGWKSLQKKRWTLGFVSGILWGAAYLIKPEGVGFLLVFLGILLVFMFIRGFKKAFPAVPLSGLAALIGFILISASYLAYLHDSVGRWTLSTKGMVDQQMSAAVYFKDEANPDPFFHLTKDNRHLPYDMAWHFGTLRELSTLEGGRQRIVDIPLADYAKKYVKNFYHLTKTSIPQLFGLALFALFVSGFFGHVLKDKNRLGYVFYLFAYIVFFWFLVIPMFHINERYLIPLFPVCFLWFGKGADVLYHWLIRAWKTGFQRRSQSTDRIVFFPFVFLLGVLLVFEFFPELARLAGIRHDNPDRWADPVELKQAGLWLRGHTDHPAILMSPNKAVDFYAGQYDIRKGASFSYDSVERNVAYSRHQGVEYLVCSSRYLFWFPVMSQLIDGRNIPPGLSLIYKSDQPAGIKTAIYRLAPDPSLKNEREIR